MKQLKIDGCVNCRVCEMACSLHHTGAFSYENSSIKVERKEDGFYMSFTEPFSCDSCEGEGIGNYQCVKYCYRAKNALLNFVTNAEGAEE